MIWRTWIHNPLGNDKGEDIKVDLDGDVFVTGYLFDSESKKNDLVTMKLEGVSGDIVWIKKPCTLFESKGHCLSIESGEYIWIGGNTKSRLDTYDFLVLKMDMFGNLQWQRKYDNVTYHGDDVATDILVDDYFVYVMGYTYNGLSTRNDMMMVVYDKSGNFSSRSIYEKKGNEYPTGFILSEVSRSPWVKSRTTSTGFSDNVINHGTRDFLTITFNNDLNSNVLWAKTYDNINDNDVPTAVTSYRKGNTSSVYVTGYTRNTSSLYDFVTIRYDQKTGNEDWVKFFD